MKCACGSEVEMRDVQIGGDGYGGRCAGVMDAPAVVECEDCGREYCDGDLVSEMLCDRCGHRCGVRELEVVSKPQDPPCGVSSHYEDHVCPECSSSAIYPTP